MRCIFSPSNDAWFNLAAEEFLFRNYGNDLLLLYINEPSIVVGKHQNALAEINYGFVKEKNIKVVRRISGGGAVYHDGGNLNFSFHKTVGDASKVSFRIFSEPIAEILNSLGIPAEINKRNDIVVDGFKVSGHAEHVFRNRILSHGTLLFDADKVSLSNALKSNEANFKGKAIASVRSKVANLIDYLPQKISIHELAQQLLTHFSSFDEEGSLGCLTETELFEIQKLVIEKYSKWDWNYGYSPKYSFENESITSKGLVLGCSLQVEKGMIIQITLTGNYFEHVDIHSISNILTGLPHCEKEICSGLSNVLSPEQIDTVLWLLF